MVLPTGKVKAVVPVLATGPLTKDASEAPVTEEPALKVIRFAEVEVTIPLVNVATSVIVIPPEAIVFVAPPKK